MCTINERIAKIRELFCNGSNKVFAQALNKTPNNTSNWTQKEYSVGRGVVSDIVKVFSDVNEEWLLTGEGEMLKKSEPIPPPDSISIPSSVWQVISDQAESLKAKDRQMDTMLESLRSKDTQTTEVIELLKEQLKKGLDVGLTSRVANLVVDDE